MFHGRRQLTAFDDDRARGLVVAALGIVIISPDALVLRLLVVDSRTILGWRGLLTGLGLFVLLRLRYGAEMREKVRAIGRPGIVILVLSVIGNQLFVYSIVVGSAATTLITMAAAPIVAGILAWITIAERPPVGTFVAAVAVGLGVVILMGAPSGGEPGIAKIAALGGMAAIAGQLTLMRRSRALDMVPAIAAGQLVIGLIHLPATRFDLPLGDITLLVVSGLIALPVATMLFTTAPRHLPAAQVGLFLPLETVLGTSLVWWVAGEPPGEGALIGGTVVIVALLIHSWATLKTKRTLVPIVPFTETGGL